MVGKSVKMTPIQVQMLVDILNENSEIATGKLTSSFTREERNNKWQAIATLLNSKELGPQKTADQWRKSWTDLKCTIRTKAAKIELVGGTDMLNAKLSNLEKCVLQLTGDITPVHSSEGETKVLTGKLWLKKLEDDLIKTEADLIKVMKKPNRIALPDSYSKIINLPIDSINSPVKTPIVENVGVKKDTDQKAANDDDSDIDEDDNVKNDDCVHVSNDGSDDDIIYDYSDDEEIYDNDTTIPLSAPVKKRKVSFVDKTSIASTESKAPAKKRKVSSVDMTPTASTESRSFISIFQKQIETQTAMLKEQTNIMKDISKSLRLIANALHDR